MSLPTLTDEQIRTWTLAQKDRWWRDNVYRGDLPQLTIRAALTGVVLGGILSVTNLYVGIRTGWTLGVGLTSVILAFALFRLLGRLGLSRDMTILENNAMQSIATAAGYMTAPLISSIPAYMLVTGTVVPASHVAIWMIVLSILGVLFAFPLKKRFINDEQMPFPEGYAAAVVMQNLHAGRADEGLWKAKVLLSGAALSGVIELLRNARVMTALRLKLLTLPEHWDDLIYRFATPRLLGTPLRDLTIRFDSSIVMMGTGGLMGARTALSLLLGGFVNYILLAPALIRSGIITGPGFRNITMWSLWGGAALMTTASLFAFFAKPRIIWEAIAGPIRRWRTGRTESSGRGRLASAEAGAEDILADIELPMSVFAVGIPVVGLGAVAVSYAFFGLDLLLGIIAVPMVFVFTLIAVNSTALTSITPGSALGKLTQLTFSGLAPGNIPTNVIAAGITSEVSLNAANLLMDIKPGYMLGAKPRQQAIGHVLGIIAGSLVAVPVYYLIFQGDLSLLASERLPMPSAQVWRSVAEILAKGLGFLHPTAQIAIVVGALAGIAIEALNRRASRRGRGFPISGVALGLGFILQFADTLAMALGASLFLLLGRKQRPGSRRHRLFVEGRETLCAGVIAGGSIVGIILIILENVILR